jgi:hypothetical protein
MPVNTAALKTFAPAMRRQLLEAVGRKLDLLLHSQTPDTLSTYARQIAELREQEAENREQLLERVAYTWFNRLCALRYLDARGWHPFGCKVLMPAAEGETQPELLKLMRAGSLPAELKPLTNEARLHGLLDGQIPPAIAGADPQGEVYRELVLASCRSYHQLLPELFEGLDDASELLLPDDLLSESSIAGGFRNAISDTDCEDVEIIGWLYQFYISEKKDQVIGKVVKSEDIPAATQLFTPNWIVKYMVQNSLGAQWLATYPTSALKGQMEYYIEPAEQTDDVKAQLAAITPNALNPEELTLIDPACGSGHILVEAYDLLKAIYLERGYRQRDIPELILTKNLYGLDICPRAAQLTTFSLLMKGREDDRRLLERDIRLNVMALQDSTDLNIERLLAGMDLSATIATHVDVRKLAELFGHATTFGSLIQVPPQLAQKLPALRHAARQTSQDLLMADELQKLKTLLSQADILARQFDVVAANPPYMGSKGMNSNLKSFSKASYPNGKNDLFSCFIDRARDLAKPKAIISMITMQSWMFLGSFSKLRASLLSSSTITSFVHIGFNSFPSLNSKIALASVFSSINFKIPAFRTIFVDLNSSPQSSDKAAEFSSRGVSNSYILESEALQVIPGGPIAYWLSPKAISAYIDGKPIGKIAYGQPGLQTSNNALFVRQWSEVSYSGIGVELQSSQDARDSRLKWFPYLKGGDWRKWYGNQEHIVDWQNDGEAIKDYVNTEYPYLNGNIDYVVKDRGYYFKRLITYTKICISFGARAAGKGYLFDVAGSSLFPGDEDYLVVLGFLCSKLGQMYIKAQNATLNIQAGDIDNLPLRRNELEAYREFIDNSVALLIDKAKSDWDAYERSWNFLASPLLAHSCYTIFDAYQALLEARQELVQEVKCLEERLNSKYLDAYGLSGEIENSIPTDQVTLTCNPQYRYGNDLSKEELSLRSQRDAISEFLSYATGCIMGRYSLDQPGLILADSRDTQAAHFAALQVKVGKPLGQVQFKPDPDGIIPVLDGEWFEDDIVARTREFLEVTFPKSTVTENLRFIEESLGKDIRKYFCTDFYKDHLQTYKKRPIYWMVQSPKKGFACLIYLHRYTPDTLLQVLNNYFRPYLQKLEARLGQLEQDQINDSLPTRERTAARKEADKITKMLKECQAWEQDALLPLAQQRIPLYLDDGVKVNYLKLQDVLATIPGLAAKED